MLSLGGEHCFSRLLSTGHKTNPWLHEANSKLVRPGDLVAFDTDATGPEGYICDVSRTFLCGDKPTPAQRDRKSTRLNSSHANISYAVFCLKQKHHPHHDYMRP